MLSKNADHPVTVREQMRGGKGRALMAGLMEPLPAHMRLFSTITLAPGCSIGYHVHENETELFYFISGRGTVQDDDVLLEVAAGDALSTSSGHGHAVDNDGDEDLVILAAIVKD